MMFAMDCAAMTETGVNNLTRKRNEIKNEPFWSLISCPDTLSPPRKAPARGSRWKRPDIFRDVRGRGVTELSAINLDCHDLEDVHSLTIKY